MRKSSPMRNEIPTLLELQMQLRQAVLGGDAAEIAPLIRADELNPAARLGIYRNHAFATLGAVLEGTFPVVCRLVDRRFFAFAAHEYLRGHPPRSRCLVEYGADFADFIAGFEPCKDLPYLADVARFEWALNIAAMTGEARPLPIETLAGVPPEKAAYLGLRLQPSLSYLLSSWPIDAIWQAHQESEVPPIDLTRGSASLEIRRSGEGVVWRPLNPASFAFRRSLADGLAFAAAIAEANFTDPAFEIAPELHQILADGLVVAFCVLPREKGLLE
jgi:hypothetical protein